MESGRTTPGVSGAMRVPTLGETLAGNTDAMHHVVFARSDDKESLEVKTQELSVDEEKAHAQSSCIDSVNDHYADRQAGAR